PELTGFAPLVAGPDYLRKNDLSGFQCIYLLNVAAEDLPADAIEPLARYAEQGGGLAWFVGDQVKPGLYNAKLYKEWNGLFPVPLSLAKRELPEDEAAPGPDLSFAAHPVFTVFEGQDNPFIESVRIEEYLPVAEEWERDDNARKDGTATLATLRNREPVLFERRYGEGKIVACLTTAGPEWNNWPRNPSYVIFQLELEKHIALGDRTLGRREVGQPVSVSLDPAKYTEQIRIIAPSEQGERFLNIQAALETQDAARETASGGPRLVARFTETDHPGIYRVRLQPHAGEVEETWTAYNAAVTESNLLLAEDDEMRRRIGEDVEVQIQPPGNFTWMETKEAGQEIRKWVLIGLVALLLIEQLLAYLWSYHPKPVPLPARSAA
ncbi:MAG: BatA domain-containing protein, partial [Planctomycetaceae bacterium]